MWLIENILFITKTSTYIWFNNPDFTPFNTKRLSNYTSYNMGNLSGGNNYNPSFFCICKRNWIFKMAMLNHRSFIFSFKNNKSFFFYSFVIITNFITLMVKNIMWIL